MTGLMVGYKVINIRRLLSGEDLVGQGGKLDWEPVQIGQELRCGD